MHISSYNRLQHPQFHRLHRAEWATIGESDAGDIGKSSASLILCLGTDIGDAEETAADCGLAGCKSPVSIDEHKASEKGREGAATSPTKTKDEQFSEVRAIAR